jgi:hypothetical protein
MLLAQAVALPLDLDLHNLLPTMVPVAATVVITQAGQQPLNSRSVRVRLHPTTEGLKAGLLIPTAVAGVPVVVVTVLVVWGPCVLVWSQEVQRTGGQFVALQRLASKAASMAS